MPSTPTLTVALSGGGVAGLGHIPVLAALDELGLQPASISGTSMGAVIAACYGAGMSAADIEDHTKEIIRTRFTYTWQFIARDWQGLLTGSISPEAVIDVITPAVLPRYLSEMTIPVTILATDFHQREAVVFREEEVRRSLAASIAIPGVFKPMKWNNRVLVDGGICNNLPVDVLPESDITLAVDVASEPASDASTIPGTLSSVTSSIRIMLQTMTQLQLQQRENVILVQPESRALGPLDLTKLEDAIAMSRPQTEQVKRRLHTLLD